MTFLFVDMEMAIEVTGSILLFCLVFGMSATVDIGCLHAQLQNRKAIGTGLLLQFLVLPFLGFIVVKTLQLNHPMGITLLVVTSSPGGSYSNWWCSMFNADLALSVTMTAISTLLSVITLPMNLLLYAKFAYNDDVTASIDWRGLFISLTIVILAITLGLLASYHYNSHNFNLHANRLGNMAGIALILFSGLLSNSDSDMQLWDRDWKFFVGVALPCLLGLIVANLIATSIALLRPERVTVSIECVYQNVGIATSVALAMFDDEELAEAMGVPFYYGCVEAVFLTAYCIAAWKSGWTKAPKDVSLWTSIITSYEILAVEQKEKEQEQDGVLVEHSDAVVGVTMTTMGGAAAVVASHQGNNDDQFHYMEHSEVGQGQGGGRQETTTGVVGVGGDFFTSSPGNNSPIRRQPILSKGPKEPSFIAVPQVPRLPS